MTPKRAFRFVLGAVLVLGACSEGTGTLFGAGRPQAGPTAASPLPPLAVGREPIVRVVDRVRPAVVNVRTDVTGTGLGGGQGAEGTGFIVDPSGVIVTNFHVIERATINIRVTTADGQRLDASVIGSDADADIAVLKVDAPGPLPAAPLGDSNAARLGERVVALGFALGLEGGPSVTAGILSAKDRSIEAQDPAFGIRRYEDLLQTDAAINPGNSGGPLVDLSGRVIGINTAGVGAAAAENIGFAIAINRAKPLIDRAIAEPAAPAAYLGVQTSDVDPVVQAQFGLPVDEGALVQGVVPEAPAQEAGIRVGDIIVAFDGDDVTGSEGLQELILRHEPGDEVEVEVVGEDGEARTISVTLDSRLVPPIEG